MRARLVNGTKFRHPGADNTIIVRVRGKKGATALIVIADIW